MLTFRLRRLSSALFIAALAAFAVAGHATASTFKTLHAFCSQAKCLDGAFPALGLIKDNSSGVLYGIANQGGKTGPSGTVYALVPNGQGGYDFKLVHVFCQKKNCIDGASPSSPLVLDTNGNLYGLSGGGRFGHGTVYKLIPNADRSAWTEVTLYDFCPTATTPCPDGDGPVGALAYAGSQSGTLYDGSSLLYGVAGQGGTGMGGSLGPGVIFQLRSVTGKTKRIEKVLYNFCNLSIDCTDGNDPFGLTIDASGNLYGAAQGGGSAPNTGGGVVYRFTPGTLKQTILHTFCTYGGEPACLDGNNPITPLEWDAQGRLYGTTTAGGGADKGVLFRITPNGAKSTEEVLRSFCVFSNCTDGALPYGGVALDSKGNLFGTTAVGNKYPGTSCSTNLGCGTLFELKGTTYKVLHDFCEATVVSCPDGGALLYSTVFVDGAGNVFGTATEGGAHGQGTVWEYSP